MVTKTPLLIIDRLGAQWIGNFESQLAAQYDLILLTERNSKAAPGFQKIFRSEFAHFYQTQDVINKIFQDFHPGRILCLLEADLLIAAHARYVHKIPGDIYTEIDVFRNKVKMKQALTEHKIKVPDFCYAKEKEQAFLLLEKYKKIVIKPIYGFASLNVQLIQSTSELETFYTAPQNTYDISQFECEQYISGVRYHIDGIWQPKNKTKLFTVSRCSSSGLHYRTGRFLIVTPARNRNNEILQDYATNVMQALSPHKTCVFHMEVFLNHNREPIFCEVGKRPGGESSSKMFQITTGICPLYFEIKRQIEEEPNLTFSDSVKNLASWIFFYKKTGFAQLETPKEDPGWLQLRHIDVKNEHFSQPSLYSADTAATFVISGLDRKNLKENRRWIFENFKIDFLSRPYT